MKKLKILCLVLALMVAVTCVFAACQPDSGEDGKIGDDGTYRPGEEGATVKFWINGDDVEIAVFKKLVDDFNAKSKQEGWKITVNLNNRSGDYDTGLLNGLRGNKGPDVFYVGDSGYKTYAEAGYLYDITDLIESSQEYVVEDMWQTVVTRYKYDVNTSLSNTESGRYYGVPKDIGPTVIFYNETFFKGAGITVISVDAADLDAFNNGQPDDRGNTKTALGLSGTIKEMGFAKDANGKMFFNNQVPMSWAETVECANVVQTYMRKSTANGGAGRSNGYGYFTEWWFNYGWTVGGDCIQYIPTSDTDYNGGYYDFTLMENTPNFIVADDVEGTVTVNGNTYSAGEIISYTDKLGITTTASQSAGYNKNITAEVLALESSKKLNRLPSQREAFTEFVRLASKTNVPVDTVNGQVLNGYGITATPDSIGGDVGKTLSFIAGDVAMLVDGRWNVTTFREEIDGKYDWDVAPLPMYKTYYQQGDAIPEGKEVGDVKVHGVEAGHSGSVGLCINNKSAVKMAAWKFIEFIGGIEGQTAQAEAGFAIPLQRDIANSEVFLQSNQNPKNAKVFIDAAEYEKAGDWWYLRNKQWIDDWAGVLNGDVRNGDKTMTEFFESNEYNSTYSKLLKYTQK